MIHLWAAPIAYSTPKPKAGLKPTFRSPLQKPMKLKHNPVHRLRCRVAWQRCQFHLQQNANAYVPRQSMKAEVATDIRAVFNAPDRAMAETLLDQIVRKYAQKASRLAEWIETNLPKGLTVFSFPAAHQRRIRTTNGLVRVSQEIRRHTRVVRIFPNEAYCLRLVSALLIEISEEWKTGRRYLNFEGAKEAIAQ